LHSGLGIKNEHAVSDLIQSDARKNKLAGPLCGLGLRMLASHEAQIVRLRKNSAKVVTRAAGHSSKKHALTIQCMWLAKGTGSSCRPYAKL